MRHDAAERPRRKPCGGRTRRARARERALAGWADWGSPGSRSCRRLADPRRRQTCAGRRPERARSHEDRPTGEPWRARPGKQLFTAQALAGSLPAVGAGEGNLAGQPRRLARSGGQTPPSEPRRTNPGKQSLRAALWPASPIGQTLAGRPGDGALAGGPRRADPGKNNAITLNSERAARPSEECPADMPSRNYGAEVGAGQTPRAPGQRSSARARNQASRRQWSRRALVARGSAAAPGHSRASPFSLNWTWPASRRGGRPFPM